MYLPKRDELSLRRVFEFPKPSSTGLHARIYSPIDSSSFFSSSPSTGSGLTMLVR